VQFGDGTRCYLTGPPAPYGTLAELVPVPDPAGIDPGLAAALGVAGLVGWLALDYRGHLQPGETVLVLGAGGSAGQLAMQSARVLGASRVVGATRGKAVEQPADGGADAVVDLADDQAIDAGLAAAAPGGYDVIVDFLSGGLAPHAMNHANVGARYVQVGSSAGPTSTIAAAAIRNKLLTLVGHGLAATPAEVRRSAYARLMHHAIDGKVTLDLEQNTAGRHQPDLGAPQDRAITQTRGHALSPAHRNSNYPSLSKRYLPIAPAHAVPADFRSSQPHPRSGMCGTFPRKRRGAAKRDDDRGWRSVGGTHVSVGP
jgi:NADPH2:quinone reductase